MNKKNIIVGFGLLFLGILLGFIIGIILNYLWFFFLALIVGWGDSAPGWYVEVQDFIHIAIVVVSVISCIILLQWRNYHSMKQGR